MEHVKLASNERIESVGLYAGGLDGAERVRIAEQLPPFELDALAARRRLG